MSASSGNGSSCGGGGAADDFSFQMGGNLPAGFKEPLSPRPLVNRGSSQNLAAANGNAPGAENPQQMPAAPTLGKPPGREAGPAPLTPTSPAAKQMPPPQQGGSTGAAAAAEANEEEPAGSSAVTRMLVAPEKGFTQVDWLHLTKSGADLAGLKGGPRRRIRMEEVKQHRTQEDCWTVLHGRVYNIGPYLKFHPGGVDYLMKGAGRDSTSLFNKYHPWVNFDFLLDKCLVGILDTDSG